MPQYLEYQHIATSSVCEKIASIENEWESCCESPKKRQHAVPKHIAVWQVFSETNARYKCAHSHSMRCDAKMVRKNRTASFISICFIIPSDYFNLNVLFENLNWHNWRLDYVKTLGNFHFDTVLNAIVKAFIECCNMFGTPSFSLSLFLARSKPICAMDAN